MTTTLLFSGPVEAGDEYRVDDDDQALGAVWIGNRDVVAEVIRAFGGETACADERKRVTVGIVDQQFDGDLFVEYGWGYSEWTPMDPDKLRVGDHDLIEIILRAAGPDLSVPVTLVISDGPIDLFTVLQPGAPSSDWPGPGTAS